MIGVGTVSLLVLLACATAFVRGFIGAMSWHLYPYRPGPRHALQGAAGFVWWVIVVYLVVAFVPVT